MGVPSLFPLFIDPLRTGTINIFGGAVTTLIQGAITVTLEDELEVEQELAFPVEVVNEITINVDVCD